MAVDLAVARRQLVEVLGDNVQTYWNNMKLWYKQKISKDEFDAQARQYIGNDNIHVHNEFLLAILAKCQALGPTPANQPRTPQKLPPKLKLIKKGKIRNQKRASSNTNFEQRFCPTNTLRDTPLMSLKDLTEDSEIGLCSYDLTLPDTATIHGRLFLGAWDAGLENVADETVSLLLHATEHVLKDVLTACCARRSAFKLKHGHFRHGLGTSYPQMHLRNSPATWPPSSESRSSTGVSDSGRTLEQAEAEAAVVVAASCDSQLTAQSPISLVDLRDALQVHRRVLPSHTVYAANVERLLSRMWHPGHDEIEQNQLHKLEAKRRFERLKQQRSLRM